MLAFMVFVRHPMTGFVKVDAVPQTNPVRELYLALPQRRQPQWRTITRQRIPRNRCPNFVQLSAEDFR